MCDAAGILDDLDLARRLVPALAAETPARTQALTQRELMLGDGGTSVAERVNLALEAWKTPVSGTTFVFENAEHIARNASARDFFARLLTQRPEGRAIVICSRESLRVHLTRFAPPHEILTLRADDLAFNRTEVASLFRANSDDPVLLARIMQLSQGWPIAVFLLKRFANEGRIETLLESLDDVAFEELHDYLADQVLASLDPALVEALFVCACVPNAKVEDLQAALSDDTAVRALADFAKESPFLTRTADGTFHMHPLLGSLLLEHHEQRRSEVLARTAETLAKDKHYQRAAELHLARGDQAAAAQALGQHEVIRDHAPSMQYARILSSLDRTLVQRYPRLWAVTALLRMFCIDTEELLDEAESLWRTLSPDVTQLERYYILVFRILFMSYIGLLEEAEEMLERFASDNGVGDEPKNYFEGYLFYLLGLMRSRNGEVNRAERDLTMALPLVGGMDIMASGTLLSLGSDIARVRGEFAVARQFIDRALESARRSGLYNFVALDLAEGAFGAWLSGDDAAFVRYSAELDEVVQRNGVRGFAYFAAAARGRSEEPHDADLLKWVACARMIASASAPQTTLAIKHARAAVTAAQQYRAPFIEGLALITLANFDDLHFDEHMSQALERAQRCGTPAFIKAVEAVAQRRADFGMLNGFMARLQRERTERVPLLEIGLTDGSVRCAGRTVTLSERELALLVALALRRETVPRARLADLLWSELDEYAARNSLSVCLHRLRQHLGNDQAIVRTKDGYCLHDDVRVDLWEIDRAVSILRSRPALADSERTLLESVYEKLRSRRPDRMSQWEFFEPTERRINELRLEVAQRLASDALSHGSARRALELAEEMIGYDPCDEAARQIAITAHLATGDRGAAIRQYRQYRDTLLAELQCEPSDSIKRLVGVS
ncbi:MAG TPA: BTAD domain-containing putative transcriptional regulator [Candidatus Baltobacteraceae bacterium]|nr:BTAD domain-containing putative transcriptional regulator [Candidatus Baltobacteraceae bacterium]